MRTFVLMALPIAVSFCGLAMANAKTPLPGGNARGAPTILCSGELPDRLPAGFGSFIEVANVIYGHVMADKIMSIERTLREYRLCPPGRTMAVQFVFHSSGGVHFTTVTVPLEDEKRVLQISTGRTGVHRLMQSNMFWNGKCEVVVNQGRIVSFREYEVDADEKAAYHVGLQVEWSPDGEIVSEEYLEERRPFFRLNIGDERGDGVDQESEK